MNESLGRVVNSLLEGSEVHSAEVEAAFDVIFNGAADGIEIAALLTALRFGGETTAAILGAARSMRRHAIPITCQSTGLLDTCGTGGSGLHTFNISTATALVVAAAGIPVSKHGNRGVTSKSGSADVLEALGVNLELFPEQVGQCIDRVGIGFCFAQKVHTAMKYAAPVRKMLGFRTIFNLLGPLTNPSNASFQLLGTGNVTQARKLANVLQQLGIQRGLVVSGGSQLGEITLWGNTTAILVTADSSEELSWQASDFQLPECQLADIQINSPAESAAIIQTILQGRPGACRNTVLANSAAALLVSGTVKTLPAGVELAARIIDEGKAANLLQHFVEFTRSFNN